MCILKSLAENAVGTRVFLAGNRRIREISDTRTAGHKHSLMS